MGHDGTPTGKRWLRWLPAAVLVGSLGLDLLTPPDVSTFPLLAAAPVMAAPVLSRRGTLAVGAAAVVTGLLDVVLEGRDLFSASEAVPFASIVVLTVLAVFLNRVMARDRQQLRTAREVAEAVQRAVLPAPAGRVGPLTVAARYQAAAREAAVGGDLYAVHATRHGVRLMIGDVRGKGLGAVRAVNALLGAFDEAAVHLPDLPAVVRRLEERMRRLNTPPDGAEGETFATAVVAELPVGGTVLRVVNRGHPAPLLVHRGLVRPLEPAVPALPLGLADLGGPRAPVTVDRYDLPEDAVLVLFTDGVTEARDRDGTFYDPVPALSRPLPPDPGRVLDALLADLDRHAAGGLTDDVALLALTRHRSGPAPPGAGSRSRGPRGRPRPSASRADDPRR
ncbi:PP2C family protein-serine/threonine phosphatase [Streptomyces sp. NPDC059506]|uniref:PP2C family protein-serine/threonine phosphatase n=1 Tax=Streptomyces TaxID=1883 RepID=UPI0015F9C7AF|nr:PP2C family protein-serine/threonine phosphatase [Streptomyces sp. SCUT-3]QMV20651.1 SpoIIE family protein phosphatase [Streptomyces sp. SCUT-3]